jgi:hypothetical protein
MSCADLFVGVFELVNHFRFEIVESLIEPRNILLARHMSDDMREHLADFLERRFLRSPHMRQVYHTAAN